jgi:hypothetical protein
MTQSDSAASADPGGLVRLSTDALRDFRDRERARYEAIKARATPFNLARGKPATEQVALADQLLSAVTTSEQCWAEDGNDCRNYYGSPQGLMEAAGCSRRCSVRRPNRYWSPTIRACR